MKKIGVILSGNGVYDGSEIQESVFTLLAIDECGAEAVCFAPDMNQHHVVNHLTGEEMDEKRNILLEAARIARGKIFPLSKFDAFQLDGLIIPGGFGAAKNLTKWAFSGPDGDILTEVKNAIIGMAELNKPIAGLCMGPTVIAKAMEGSNRKPILTVGTTKAPSPYEIAAISAGMEKTGAIAEMHTIDEIAVDEMNKIVTAPCYMMEASISQVKQNISLAVSKLMEMVNK